MRFLSEQHLRHQYDIRAAREKGTRLDCGAFTIWWRRPEAPIGTLPRVAVVASIAAVGPSVDRSRAKRRLREIFRHNQNLLPRGCDLLLVARAAVNRWEFRELEKKFTDACGKIAAAASPTRK
jgi:ribonuclease P protein component